MSLAVADVTILLNCYQVVIQVISGGPVLGTLGILSLLLIYFTAQPDKDNFQLNSKWQWQRCLDIACINNVQDLNKHI